MWLKGNLQYIFVLVCYRQHQICHPKKIRNSGNILPMMRRNRTMGSPNQPFLRSILFLPNHLISRLIIHEQIGIRITHDFHIQVFTKRMSDSFLPVQFSRIKQFPSLVLQARIVGPRDRSGPKGIGIIAKQFILKIAGVMQRMIQLRFGLRIEQDIGINIFTDIILYHSL